MKTETNGKGEHMNKCNRSACLKEPATHYNDSTRAYYCEECADQINYWSMKDHGVILCHRTPTNER